MRETQSRLTLEPSLDNGNPVWTADGSHIFFSSNRKGLFDLYWKLSNGAAKEELLHSSEENKYADDVSRDSRCLIFVKDNARGGHLELWVLPLTGERKPWPYLATEFDVYNAAFSPDGHWVAYVSTESGRPEVFVQSFPETGEKFQISTGRADSPVRRADGKELFYIGTDNKVMAFLRYLFPAQIREFIGPSSRTKFGVSRDGQRILVNALQPESVRTPITVVVNWVSELKKSK